MGGVQQAKLYSLQIERVFDGVESSPFLGQSSADVRVHSQLRTAVIQLVLSGPFEDFFLLLETEEFNDENARSPHTSISGSWAEGAMSPLYLRWAAENIGTRHHHQQVGCKLGQVLVPLAPLGDVDDS